MPRIRRIPWPFLLLLGGSLIATAQLFSSPPFPSDLILAVFIPPLLFEAAFSLDLASVRRQAGWILLFGVGGSAFAGLGSLLLLSLLGFSWPLALLLSAALAATDPISVFAVFRGLRMHERVSTVLKGESLANDGVAVVLFSAALVLVGQSSANGVDVILLFLRLLFGGVACGLIIGLALQPLIGRLPVPISIAAGVAAAYGSYALASLLGFSGLLSVIATAMYLSYLLPSAARITLSNFWEWVGFAASALVFLLVGLQVRLDVLWTKAGSIMEVWLAVLIARGIMVALFTAPRRHLWPWHWRATLVWSGLRGALSLALVLSVPAQVRERATLITLAFGFVFVSLVAQGLTIGPFFRVIDRRRRMVKSLTT